MNHYGRATQKITSLLILSAAIAACGGGGGSSGGGNPGGSGPGGGNPGGGGLSGLSGDAGNQDLLYFSNSFQSGENTNTGQLQYTSTLYAIDPANPDVATALVLDTQESAQGNDMGRSQYVPLYEADINEDDGSVTNWRVSDVLFLHNRDAGVASSEGFARVSTEGTTPAAVRVSAETYLGATVKGTGTLVRQNYADADHASVVYGPPGAEKRVRMTYDGTTNPQESMSSIVRHIAALGEEDTPGTQSYLVLRSHDDTQCAGGYRLVDARASATPNGPSSMGADNLLPNSREAVNAAALGGPLADGTQYLVIDTVSSACQSEGGSVWRYRSSAGTQLVQVLNEDDEPLILPENFMGYAIMPQSRLLTREGDVLYFGVTGALSFDAQDLYRIEGDSWSFLSEQEDNLGFYTGFVIADEGRVAASVGNAVVSWNGDGSDRQVLDGTEATWTGAIMTEVLGSRDGWIFYNRADINGQDNAVAMKIDGSDSLAVANAQWVGASSSGKGESISNMSELSEVFLWRGRDIAAVSAADPKAGLVLLGSLASEPENVIMHGLAPGPHRLIQVQPDADEDSAVAYYVNTREANSLRKPLADAGYQRPVDGF